MIHHCSLLASTVAVFIFLRLDRLKGECAATSLPSMGPNQLVVGSVVALIGITGVLKSGQDLASAVCPQAVECRCVCSSEDSCCTDAAWSPASAPASAPAPAVALPLGGLLSGWWAALMRAAQGACLVVASAVATLAWSWCGAARRQPPPQLADQPPPVLRRRASPLGHLAVDASEL